MNRFFATLGLLCFILPLSPRAEDVLIMNVLGQKGAMQYSVQREKAAHLPRWDTTDKKPPLSMDAAVQIAKARYRKAYREIKRWRPVSVSLSSSLRKDKDYVWYYAITLQPEGDASFRTIDDTVMVLMDGSVIEQKPMKK